jgi:hypothetical protein
MAPKIRNSSLLDNGSVSTFTWQQIDAVTDELFETVVSVRLGLSYKREFVRELIY